jgi:hypothetical protein
VRQRKSRCLKQNTILKENTVMISTDNQASSQQEAQTITTEIWNTGSSAEIMFQMLWESSLFHPSRILRFAPHLHLFAAWCARRTSHLLIDKTSHLAIHIAERFATASVSCSVMNQARIAAEAVVIRLAATDKNLTPCTTMATTSTNHPSSSIDTGATRTAALLNAASAAATCCLTYQIFAPLRAAELCAKYARQSLYWDALTNGYDPVLIAELLEQEDSRQAQTLRVFLGNPFNPHQSPPMSLPEPQFDDLHQSCS